MSFDDPADQRFVPDDGCPLFSPALEDHLVAVTRGESPNRGRFCGYCFTPLSRDTTVCPHCGTQTTPANGGRQPVDRVPDAVLEALRVQRQIESRWVNGMAYLGLLIATLGGLAVVLLVPALKGSLIWATIAYGIILLVGGRVLAGLLGGYLGDRLGYDKGRAATRAAWHDLEAARES